MATFFMFGKYSPEAIKGISSQRTTKIRDLISKFGGDVRGMYALVGECDLAFIVEYPGISEAVKTSVAITKMTGITFSTAPAVTVEEFDTLTKGV